MPKRRSRRRSTALVRYVSRPPARRSGGGMRRVRRSFRGLGKASAAERKMKEVIRTTLTTASAYGWAYLQGRYYDSMVLSNGTIPVVLLAGVGGNLLGLLGFGGKNRDHLHALANGALAVYAVTKGTAAGAAARGVASVQGYPEDLT